VHTSSRSRVVLIFALMVGLAALVVGLAGWQASDDLLFGKYRGVVTGNADPAGMGRLLARVPDLLGGIETEWAMPCVPYAGDGAGLHMIPAVGTGVWIEFEGGDPSRPIWSGCWWEAGKAPSGVEGTETIPELRVLRSESGLSVTLDDASQVLRVGHVEGGDLLTIDAKAGTLWLTAAAKVVIDAPEIELGANGTQPFVLGNSLYQYLQLLATQLNTHVHAVEVDGTGTVGTSVPTLPVLMPFAPDLLSTQVKGR